LSIRPICIEAAEFLAYERGGEVILPGRTKDGFYVGHYVAMWNVDTRVVELGLSLDLKPALIRPGVFDRGELWLDGEGTCAISAAWSFGGECSGNEE
jgi:hypothetical protein